MALQPLTALRLRLTAWYVLTLGLILSLLGGGLFVVIRGQFTRQLDASLREATKELERAAAIRERERTAAKGAVVDAVDELHIPDRTLYLMSPDGTPVKPATIPGWVRDVAPRAAAAGSADARRHEHPERNLRLHAERFTLPGGQVMVAAALADQVELEDQYAALIAAFSGAALAALVLVAAGGWFLSRKSTAPVERTISYMRRFMADAAHELRAPVAVLRTSAEVALQAPRDPAAYADTLRVIEREAERLGGIVDDLLTLARADAGERPLKREPFFLDDVVLESAEAARALAGAKGVELTLGAFDEAPVEGDADLVRQLVMNLLQNAVKFTPGGGTVRVDVLQDDGASVAIIEDSGVGIAPEHLPHVFERFYRADAARGRGDGAGLGLSIARWIADAHGATLRLTSAPGAGTRAEVRFPRTGRSGVSSS
jgi:signal transduction histidine kinase